MKKINLLFWINLFASSIVVPIEVKNTPDSSAELEKVLASQSDSDFAMLQETHAQINLETETLRQTLSQNSSSPLANSARGPRPAAVKNPSPAASQVRKTAPA